MGIAVLVPLRIRRKTILVALLVRGVVLYTILDEPVLAGTDLTVDLSGVNVSDLGVGDFARAGSAIAVLFGVLSELLRDGGLGFGAVERGG